MVVVAFDTETELIVPGNQAPHLICLTWTDDLGQPQIVHWKQAREIARELILNATASSPLVGHNTAFDLCVLAKQFPDLIPLIFDAYERSAIADTVIREKMIDIAVGRDRRAEKGAYTLTDAKSTLQVYLAQQQALDGDTNLLLDAPAQCRADFALRLAANHGMVTNPVTVAKFGRQLQEEFQQTKAKLVLSGLLKKNGVRDTQKAKARLQGILGHDVQTTATGQIQLNEDSCLASKDEALITYSRFAKLQTLMSKDYPILERGTREPIHTYFNVLMNTGRTSSSRPNLQNPRREPGVRECYIPRPGYVFASADYEAAELHTLAQVCLFYFGYSVLADQLNAHIDPHLALAAQLLGMNYEEAVAGKKASDPKIMETRQMAKAANFGFPGGMGPSTFRAYAKGYGFNLSEDESKQLRWQWLDSFPEMKDYFAYISVLCGQSGQANLIHLVSKRRRGNVNYTAACNSFFQGMAADGAKRALFEVQKHCQSKPESALYGSHIVNFLHDEIMLEVPEERGHEAATQLAEIMVREFNHFVPDVPVQASPQLMRCWSKNAKPIYNAQDRLVPWQLGEGK